MQKETNSCENCRLFSWSLHSWLTCKSGGTTNKTADREIWLLRELQMQNHMSGMHDCKQGLVKWVTWLSNLRVADQCTASPCLDHGWSSTRGQDAIQSQLSVLRPTTPSRAAGKKWKDWQCHSSRAWRSQAETAATHVVVGLGWLPGGFYSRSIQYNQRFIS